MGRNLSFYRKFGTLIYLVAAIIFGIVSVIIVNRWIVDGNNRHFDKLHKEYATTINKQNENILFLQREIEKLNQIISGTPGGSKQIQQKAETVKFNAKVQALSDRMLALEQALSSDPAKAISIPLLKINLDNVEKSLRHDLEQNQKYYDRIRTRTGLSYIL